MTEPATVSLAPGIVGRIQEGDGDAVLWLHGYTLDSSSWRGLWGRLPGWRHVGIDLPGHGGSDLISPDLDLSKLARVLLELCEAEEVRHVVGLSFGTLAATQLAIDAPDRFASITLGAPSLAGGPQDQEVGRAYGELFGLYHRVGPGPTLADQWMKCVAWQGIERDPELREELRSIVARHSWDELRSYGMTAFLKPLQEEASLQRITSPVLLLVGDAERPAFLTCADTLQRCLPSCAHRVLHDTHHLCMLESPDQAAPMIADHLSTHAVRRPVVPFSAQGVEP